MAAVTNQGGPKAAKACDEAIGVLIGELRRLEQAETIPAMEKIETGSGSE
ncbi:MAG: hypothetical protein GY871_01040 [Actinomycetales bacterium]|nr:hypothetical protein [Actinomycetales bacterium]